MGGIEGFKSKVAFYQPASEILNLKAKYL